MKPTANIENNKQASGARSEIPAKGAQKDNIYTLCIYPRRNIYDNQNCNTQLPRPMLWH
jgi:hypothetical protein